MRRRIALPAFLSLWIGGAVSAWEFTPGAPCVLTNSTPDVDITLTYDPTKPLYSISLKKTQPFPQAPVFGLQFSGALPLAIGTDRHIFSEGRTRVTVEDSGFGNVLNGLQFNDAMTALVGAELIAVSLAGAAGPTEAFRACESAPSLS